MRKTSLTDWLTHIQNILQPSFVGPSYVVGISLQCLCCNPALYWGSLFHPGVDADAYGETSCRQTFPDDGVRLARLYQVTGLIRRRRTDIATARRTAEVPDGDVDSLPSACLDDPRALRGTSLRAVGHGAADVAAPGREGERG